MTVVQFVLFRFAKATWWSKRMCVTMQNSFIRTAWSHGCDSLEWREPVRFVVSPYQLDSVRLQRVARLHRLHSRSLCACVCAAAEGAYRELRRRGQDHRRPHLEGEMDHDLSMVISK